MNSLQSFQNNFVRSVLSGSYNKKLMSSIRPGGSLDNGSAALRVHENGYYARLTDALGETFEAVWWVLGDEKFFDVARKYIKNNPSVSPNLSDYGLTFPDHLTVQTDLREFPFLNDLARFEWEFKTVFHKPQHSLDNSVDFAKNPISDHSIFRFAPSVRLHHGEHTIFPIWELRATADKPRTLPDFTKPEYLFLYKKDSEVYIQSVTPGEFQILDNLVLGKNLEETLEIPAESFDISSKIVQALFQSLAQTGAIIGLT